MLRLVFGCAPAEGGRQQHLERRMKAAFKGWSRRRDEAPSAKTVAERGGYYDRWQSCPWCPMKGVETRRASKIYNLQRCCMMLWHIIMNLTSFGKESFEACSFDRWVLYTPPCHQLVSSEASSPNADRCECGLKGWRSNALKYAIKIMSNYFCSRGGV